MQIEYVSGPRIPGIHADVHVSQVVQEIGLCICVYDILKASDGLIGHGSGLVNVNGMSITDNEVVKRSLIGQSGVPSHGVSTFQRRDHTREDQ